MRSALLALLLCLGQAFQVVHAQGNSPPAIALVGTWAKADKLPNGATMAASVVLNRDMKFTGSVTVNGALFWEYAGTWSVAGNTLTWRYETSSRPLPDSAKVDTDEIISVEATKLVLLSKLSGKQHEYVRTK